MRRRNYNKRTRPRYLRIIIALGLMLGLIFWILNLSFFDINSIQVEGNDSVSDLDILESANIPRDQSIVFLNKKEISKSIKSIPLIESVKIKRRPLMKLVLEVKERVPVAYIPTGSQYLLLDQNGIIYDKRENPVSGIMSIKGITLSDDLKMGTMIYNDLDASKLIKSIIECGIYEDIKILKLEENDAKMVMNTDIDVDFGSYRDIDYKLSALDEIYNQVISTDRENRALMILMEDGPDPILVMSDL